MDKTYEIEDFSSDKNILDYTGMKDYIHEILLVFKFNRYDISKIISDIEKLNIDESYEKYDGEEFIFKITRLK